MKQGSGIIIRGVAKGRVQVDRQMGKGERGQRANKQKEIEKRQERKRLKEW